MILKVVVLFLVAMGVMAMFGKLHFPGIGPGKGRQARLSTKKCPRCGAYRIGKGPCNCGQK